MRNIAEQHCGTTLRNNIAEQHCGNFFDNMSFQEIFGKIFFEKTRKVSLEKLIVSKASTSISGLATKIRAKDLGKKGAKYAN